MDIQNWLEFMCRQAASSGPGYQHWRGVAPDGNLVSTCLGNLWSHACDLCWTIMRVGLFDTCSLQQNPWILRTGLGSHLLWIVPFLIDVSSGWNEKLLVKHITNKSMKAILQTISIPQIIRKKKAIQPHTAKLFCKIAMPNLYASSGFCAACALAKLSPNAG